MGAIHIILLSTGLTLAYTVSVTLAPPRVLMVGLDTETDALVSSRKATTETVPTILLLRQQSAGTLNLHETSTRGGEACSRQVIPMTLQHFPIITVRRPGSSSIQ